MFKYLFILVISISCTRSDTSTKLSNITGYWEINKVIAPNGDEKHYKFNQNIDYFEIKDTTGIRKKLQPQFDGTFKATGDSERFQIKKTSDSVHFMYKNSWSSWKETILVAEKDKLLIINEEGIQYEYRPYEKLNLTDE
ncbi:hypothetical protein NBT05_13395 [Aquimarina sp. ERC-38]|uniref:hypothetical protein n=1 Tax=Aquimarina sp. ERC-38 TaxID=2949996 RepID=UPI0022459A9C|nr:hypothetical protein [Aquimarina sp. ERC-38]UZO79939.1 hypothetical protein NBT05_13395 [Aquimarina sp. ERC-38]